MEVPLDYTITRAAGIKMHFFSSEKYRELAKLPDFDTLIDQLRLSNYDRILASYYTSANQISSYNRSMLLMSERRWQILTDNIVKSLRSQIRIYKQLIDIENLIAILPKLSTDTKDESKKTLTITPGGTISQPKWQELVMTSGWREFLNKLAILNANLYELIHRIPVQQKPQVEVSYHLFEILNQMIFGRNKPTIIQPSSLSFLILEQVNHLILRLCQHQHQVKAKYLEMITSNLSYWTSMPGFIGHSLVNNTDNQWTTSCKEELRDQLRTYNIEVTPEVEFLEDYSTQLVFLSMKRYGRFKNNPTTQLFEVLYQTNLECRNLIWLGLGIFNGFDPELIISRVIV